MTRLYHATRQASCSRRTCADDCRRLARRRRAEKLVDVETTIANLRAIRASASVFHYTDIRREPTPSGFVQQHTLIVEMPNGRGMRDLCCCVCRVEDGRIAHMDGYHDSAVVNGMAHRARPDAG
jgi:ketosteroid isomerase-like protein